MGKIEIPLDIEGVRVIEAEINEKREIIIKVENIEEGTKCRKCGREIKNFHGYDREIRLRHLPVFNRKVYIEIRPKRYRCPYCEGNPTTTQKSEWYEANSAHTKAYEQMILVELINSTIVDCSKKQAISQEEVEGIIDRNIKTSVDWEIYESVPVIGIDEIALKKGHKDYVAIISTMGEQGVEIIAVLEDRKKETVKTFLSKIPSRIKLTIERVCTDLYEGYINAAKEELPQAQIVADRFHIAKAYREGADKERKSELKRLKKELSETEYEELKGVMWPFRLNPLDLEVEQKSQLEKLFSLSPSLKMAYDFREELTEIFDKSPSKIEARLSILSWADRVKNSSLSCFDSFLTTLNNHLDSITNYFLDRESSGFVEGLNNKIKVLKRRSYGIFTSSRIFQRLWLDLNGYHFFAFS
jgi:transposase